MKNTTITIRIDRTSLEVMNFIIISAGPAYLEAAYNSEPLYELSKARASMNLQALWYKISTHLVVTKFKSQVKKASSKRSFGIDINQWGTFQALCNWYKSPDPLVEAVCRDIHEQLRKKAAEIPKFIKPDTAKI